MKIRKITFTGADNTILPNELVDISKANPHTEWGILFSKNQESSPRFPSYEWVEELAAVKGDMNLSCHLCGNWLYEVCNGNWNFLEERPVVKGMFDRIQLNFHGIHHNISEQAFVEGLLNAQQYFPEGFIFQFDNVNNELMNAAIKEGVLALPFFDTSHGAGVVPQSWPNLSEGIGGESLCGYSGGLGPHNLKEELVKIEEAVGDQTIWVDMETRVRDEHNVFSLLKVKECIEIARKYYE